MAAGTTPKASKASKTAKTSTAKTSPRKRRGADASLPAAALAPASLVALRSQIDAVDEQLHALINERAKLGTTAQEFPNTRMAIP
jgi:hypothetical protein